VRPSDRGSEEVEKIRIHCFETRRLQMRERQNRIAHRFARRGAHATVKEVLKQAIAASNHWRIIREGAAQHF
jgi:hypothetical protein